MDVVEFVSQLSPRYALEALLSARAFPTERPLSDLDCAEQFVTVADLECYRGSRFRNVPGFQGNVDRISRCNLPELRCHERPPGSSKRA
jgi:hypothetical protein